MVGHQLRSSDHISYARACRARARIVRTVHITSLRERADEVDLANWRGTVAPIRTHTPRTHVMSQ